MKRLAFAAVLALAGCNGVIDRQFPEPSPELTFRWERTAQEWYQEVPSAVVRTAAGSVVVDGRISSPHGCIDVQSTARKEARRLEVQVSVKPDIAAMCLGVVQNLDYTATLSGLPAGTYQVSVTHDFGGKPWPAGDATVHAEVTVP